MAFWQFFAVTADIGRQRILMWALLLLVVTSAITWFVTGRWRGSSAP